MLPSLAPLAPAAVWHTLGSLLIVLDAALVTLLAVYWREAEPPPARRLKPSRRPRTDDKRT